MIGYFDKARLREQWWDAATEDNTVRAWRALAEEALHLLEVQSPEDEEGQEISQFEPFSGTYNPVTGQWNPHPIL